MKLYVNYIINNDHNKEEFEKQLVKVFDGNIESFIEHKVMQDIEHDKQPHQVQDNDS